MADARIPLTLGSLAYYGAGEQDWLASQLDRVLAAAPALLEVVPSQPEPAGASTTPKADINPPVTNETGFSETLASYIKAKGGRQSGATVLGNRGLAAPTRDRTSVH